jgi:hypothetical protein
LAVSQEVTSDGALGIRGQQQRVRDTGAALIFEDAPLRAFLDQTKEIDVNPDLLKPWVLLARGEEAVPEPGQ